MRPLRFLLPLVTIGVMLAALAGCGGGGGPSFKPIELVPQGANFIADVQIARIINDKDFQDAYNSSPKSGDEPATWDQALAKLNAETGIDLHQFTDGLIFGDLSRASDYFCAIAAGSFDETQFIENVKAKSGSDFTTTSYKGYTLYTRGRRNGDLRLPGQYDAHFRHYPGSEGQHRREQGRPQPAERPASRYLQRDRQRADQGRRPDPRVGPSVAAGRFGTERHGFLAEALRRYGRGGAVDRQERQHRELPDRGPLRQLGFGA